MTAPGLTLFFGGLVRAKNLLSTLMQAFSLLSLVGLQWLVVGYSIAFGSGRFWGGGDFLLFRGVGPDPIPGQTVPHLAFASYQSMIAILAVALLQGALV